MRLCKKYDFKGIKGLKLDFDTLLCNHYPKLEHGKDRIEKNLRF